MNGDVEIISIAIPQRIYNQNIAHLIDTLLLIDQKMFPSKSLPNPQEVA